MSDLPSGTVTFLFTDVEGSTKLLHELGAEAYAEALAEHRTVIREACLAHSGVEVDTQGDAFFFAFSTAPSALKAATVAQQGLSPGQVRVRMGLHTGTPLLTDEGYVGADVHFAARVAASAHGGQVLLSKETQQLLDPSDKVLLGELGEHRLKDIPEAVAIYQLGSGSFPPLKTISNTNLPRPASSFVGRDEELLEVLSRFEDGARLVTLTGPGGTGKTRLAIEAASELVPSFKAGVFWVGLASLSDPALVTETIAQTLGAKDGVSEHIGEREMLLLLDNLEQVIEAAPELGGLLEASPNLKLLVTSREVLRIRGEVEYAVPPLDESEAVELFCERSQLESDETISELCRRLDNLPLAVELAAARTAVLTPEQILERLSQRLDLLKGGRDAGARQQTLRATIEWSFDLLSTEEQQLFARLSVFAGGCTLEAAKEVCDADLDTLQSLVDKSLLRFTDGRYWMLETIREFAAQNLETLGDGAVRRGHAEWVEALAVAARERLRGDQQVQVLDALTVELANVREALTFCVETLGANRALEIAGSLGRFWLFRGHDREGRLWLDEALRLPEAVASDVRWRAMYWDAVLTDGLGDIRAARELEESALALARELRDDFMVSASLMELARRLAGDGDVQRAEVLLEELAEAHDERTQAIAVYIHGQICLARGDSIAAITHLERALDLDMRVSDIQGVAMVSAYLGLAQAVHACDRESRRWLRKSLGIGAELGMAYGVAVCLQGVAELALREPNALGAAALLVRADGLLESVGTRLTGVEGALYDQTWKKVRLMVNDTQLERLRRDTSVGDLEEAIAHGLEFLD